MNPNPIVIVGAGPAGMSAAITLAECGLSSTVIDENARTGGQIYRQPSWTDAKSTVASKTDGSGGGAELRERFQGLANLIDFRSNTKVWGLFEGRRLALTGANRWEMIEAEKLIFATGAYEWVPPFPGWTLPGVMTPGAAQLMIKTMQVAAGKRVLLAGTGPFLLVVANYLLDAGVEVVGVVEAVRRGEALKTIPGFYGNLGLLKQGLRYLRRLKQGNVPIYPGHVILEAEGEERIERRRFAPCDRQWRPNRSLAKTVEVDTLCVGYGFVPRTELAQLSGCKMRWADHLGGWIPVVDENMTTSAAGIWVAGDGCGVAGSLAAEQEGVLTGLAVARDCHAIDESAFQQLRKPVLAKLKKLKRFRAAFDQLCRIRPGLLELAGEDTLVCRCEEITRKELETALHAGCKSYRTIKTATRIGMGPCQGRMCWPALSRWVAQKTGEPVEETGPPSVRPPITPVTVGRLAELDSIPDLVSEKSR